MERQRRVGRPARNAAQQRAWYLKHSQRPEVKARKAERTRLAYHGDPETQQRIKARNAARWEVRMGRMQRQPCEVCGDPKVQAHHDDYDKPLEVRWLCLRHHREADAALKARLGR